MPKRRGAECASGPCVSMTSSEDSAHGSISSSHMARASVSSRMPVQTPLERPVVPDVKCMGRASG